MHDIARIADACQHRLCLRAAEIVEAGLGQQRLEGIPVAALQALADGGSTDGLAVCFFAGYNDTLDTRFGQLLAHNLVVKPRHLTGRLLAHIAGSDVQRRRDFRKDGEVQPGVAVDDSCLILQEVTGEGGIRDDVGAAVVEHHIRQMGHARLHQLPAHGKRHEAGVLTDHEQVERVAGGSSFSTRY